jgi:EmrB/QacA subfamily drug resistance transporter
MSMFIVGIDNTIVNIALPTIARGLHAEVSGQQWIIDGYTMVLASLLLFAGSTADRFGRRRTFQIGLIIFTAGSALCSVAPDLDWLIAFRVLQALGGSMLNPVAMSIIASVYTTRVDRARAISVWVSVFGVSVALGPVVGGILTSAIGWRSIFWVNVPVGLFTAILAYMLVPESRARLPRRPDPVAQLLVTAGLALLVYAIIEGARSGWRADGIRVMFGVAASAFVALIVLEFRRRDPLINPRFFRAPGLTGAVLIGVCSFACLGGFLFLETIYLQDVRSFSALHAGLNLLPAAVAIAVFPAAATWLAGRAGPRLPLMLGGSALALSMAALSRVSATSGVGYLIAAYAVFGVGFAMVDGQISVGAISAMPAAQSGLASGIASTSRQVGQALGVAVSGALLNANLRGPIRVGFGTGSRTAWWVLTACGCVVLAIGVAATTLARGPRPSAGLPPGVDQPTQPIPRIPAAARSSQPTQWFPPSPRPDRGERQQPPW